METLWPLVGFALASSITPGPNNLMLSASGIAFGLRRSLPHLVGVAVGFALLLAACGFGVGAIAAAMPVVAPVLKVAGSAYLLYLAWTLRSAFAPRAATRPARPLRFVEAALFQFVNPKAWIMAVTATSVFVPTIEPRWIGIGWVTGVFVLVNLPCIGLWMGLGVALRHALEVERWRDYFRLMIAVLMLHAVLAIWMEPNRDAEVSTSGSALIEGSEVLQ